MPPKSTDFKLYLNGVELSEIPTLEIETLEIESDDPVESVWDWSGSFIMRSNNWRRMHGKCPLRPNPLKKWKRLIDELR